MSVNKRILVVSTRAAARHDGGCPVNYEDFFLQIHASGEGGHAVTVHCPAGDGSGIFQMPLTPEELWKLRDGFALENGRDGTVRDAASEARPSFRPEEIGARLFDALFTDQVRRLLAESLTLLPEDGEHGLRIKLSFDPGAGALNQLPWETLFWEDRREFLNLGRKTPLVRYLNVPRAMRPRLSFPLRVLLASACPPGVDFLDLDGETRKVEDALKRLPGVEVHPLVHATPQGLRDKLLEQPFHVLHFMGHGSFDVRSGDGALLLEDEDGRAARIPGRVVANLLRDFSSLRLTFLNACRTACSTSVEGLDPFGGVASALVMAGMPAVLAMQFPVSDEAAIQFSTGFYRRIAAGDPVDAAATEGRMAVHLKDPGSPEWATPALFLRTWDGRLFEPVSRSFRGDGSSTIQGDITDSSALVQTKTEGFVGRRWVFEAIDRFTREESRGYFIVRGEPGIGKTSLIAEMVRREKAVHHFNIQSAGIRTPQQFLRNVCAQLIATYGLDYSSLPADATEGSAFLTVLLGKVAGRLRPAEKALLLIDALDESDLGALTPGANALYLPSILPPSVYLVLTTRFKDLPLRIESRLGQLDIRQDLPENLEDIREYVENHLPHSGVRTYLASQGLDETTFVTDMVGKSQGNFMYLHHVLPEIETGAFQQRPIASLPEGLENYYEDHWKRMRAQKGEDWFHQQLPVLVALTAVKEPISIDLVGRFSGLLDRRRVRPVLEEWAQFLYVAKEMDEAGRPRKLYRLYHASFFDFIAAKEPVEDERVNLEEAHRRIAEALEQP